MLHKPQFKPHFRVELRPPDCVYLLSENDHLVLRGAMFVMLAPLLDGRRTVHEICALVSQSAEAGRVHEALDLLTGRGLLCEPAEDVGGEAAAFWSILGGDAASAGQRLREAAVRISAIGGVPVDGLAGALQSLRIVTAEDATFGVVATDDYLRRELDSYNRDALAAGRPWMLLKPVGAVLWVGPVFLPGRTGCWECLAQRLSGNREVERFLKAQRANDEPLPVSRAALPTTLEAAWSLAATEIARTLVLGESELAGKLLTLDLTTLEARKHVLIRRPQCPHCGEGRAASTTAAFPALRSSVKRFTADGGHRTCAPEQTLAAYGHHVSPITGVVRSLTRWPSSDGLIHYYAAAHSLGSAREGLAGLMDRLQSPSLGKGATDTQAQTSALCEAIERYSGLYSGEETGVRRSYAAMASSAIHPNACMLFSERQYDTRHTQDAGPSAPRWVPARFDEDRDVEWTPVWSLTSGCVRYLPAAYCYYGYPLPEEHRFCRADSNGNAAGNTREEAILQGFMELVERDAVALWWYNRIRPPRVDLDGFECDYLQALQRRYRELGREIWALDITSDFDIPVFAALSRRIDASSEAICLGFGAHFDPTLALLRAMTEMNQMLVAVEATSDGKAGGEMGACWWQSATAGSHPHLTGDAESAARSRAGYSRRWSDDLRDDITVCVETAREHGMETLVLDLTRPDIGLPVVKVVVPGMRHFWPRFAGGRLYDSPVRLGWRTAPLREEDLNPVPVVW